MEYLKISTPPGASSHYNVIRENTSTMKQPVCFIGVLRLAHCKSNNLPHYPNQNAHSDIEHTKFKFTSVALRGGAGASGLHENLSATCASLLAGSIGGAIGVGVSYPFDTISTKTQVTIGNDGTSSPTLAGKIIRIFKEEGVGGFFEGVLLTMLGQALVKAIQFATNEMIVMWLSRYSTISSKVLKLLIGGIISGLVSSFVVSPVELLKIRMQAQNKMAMKNNDDNTIKTLIYKNEIDCAQWVIKNEGLLSLCTHGLWITIIREIPSFAIYFAVYGWLQHTSLATRLGYHIAPLIFGAIAGWAMWIPTYPIDVVKTIEQVQTRERNSDKDMLTWRQITAKLYRTGGVGAFFEGLEPKLARAAIKHAVTFWCYEVLMNIMRPEAIY